MTTKTGLAARLSGALGISDKTSAELTERYIHELEESEGRAIDRDSIDKDDTARVMKSVKRAQRSGELGTGEMGALCRLSAEYDKALQAAESIRRERDPIIRRALDAGARVSDITRSTGLSRAAVYKIRDQR